MRKVVQLPLRHILLIGLVLLFAITFYMYLEIRDAKISALVGGISGGVAVYIIDFLFSIYEYRQIDRFRAMGVVQLLPDRRDGEYYKHIVREAEKLVQVMGTSCTRFIDDFANGANNEHVLLDALEKHPRLKVQCLLPDEEHMDASSKHRFQAGRRMFEQLRHRYDSRFEMRRFNFQARHSMVRVDGQLIVGPVFQEVESRDTPAIHLDSTSAYGEKYEAYFLWVWERSQPCE